MSSSGSLTGSESRLWFYDLSNFITAQNFYKIVPMPDYTIQAQLNALLRFAVYYALTLMLIKRTIQPVFFIIFTAAFTIGIDYYYKQVTLAEKMTLESQNLAIDKRRKEACVKPTRSNPFMNVSYTDMKENTKRQRACDITNQGVHKKVESLYEDTLVYDSDDIFKRNSSSRQFYTNPNTTIPNDQTGFANWLYKVDGRTCKEGECLAGFRTINQ